MDTYDLIVVGAGSAGLTAGIFASRRGLKTLVLSKDLGGQASTTPEIENYPGLDLIEGWDLMEKFARQLKTVGGKLCYEEVNEIDKSGDQFTVTTPKQQFQSDALILAFGKTPNDLGVPGEVQFKGTHVHYAAMREVLTFAGHTVAMIGGGNTAAGGAIMLAGVAKKVYLLVREPQMRAEKILQDRLQKQAGVVEIVYNITVDRFVGDKTLEKVVAHVENREKEFLVDDCFIGVGYSNKTEWVKHLVATDKIGQIIIQPNCSTSTPGIFAAGDVTTIPYKQIVISAGEGAKAAIAAHQFLAKKHGKVAVSIDWGLTKKS